MFQSRQLAAIMFTDIVGYTALMGEDEEKAFHLTVSGMRWNFSRLSKDVEAKFQAEHERVRVWLEKEECYNYEIIKALLS